jgi:ABC-type phosphate/phosphonate transport system substrate-binding protein
MKKRKYHFLIAFYSILIFTFSGCTANNEAQFKELIEIQDHQYLLKDLTLPTPLTSAEEDIEEKQPVEFPSNQSEPVVIGIVSSSPQTKMLRAAEEIANTIQEETGIEIQFRYFNNEDSLFLEMALFNLQFAWLSPEAFIYAKQRDLVQAGLITTHYGVTKYGTQFLANTEDNFIIYYDPRIDRNSSSTATFLKQFRNKRICLVSPNSLSGSILPLGLLRNHKIEILDYVYLESHTAVIRGLYVDGICDFGAVFSGPGDPRTSSSLGDLPNIQQKIVVIGKSEAIIPTMGLAYHKRTTDDRVEIILEAFESFSEDPDFQKQLSIAVDYQIQSLEPIEDSFYDDLEDLFTIMDINPKNLLSKE